MAEGREINRDHIVGSVYGRFCLHRGNPKCSHTDPDPNNYREVCKNLGDDWDRWNYYEGKKKIKRRGYEAHHVLCVSSVNTLPEDETTAEKLAGILHETSWCINKKGNMVALPKFGHTVYYYCSFSKPGAKLGSKPSPPAFKDRCNHDFHHNDAGAYTDEITQDIQKVWDTIAKMTAKKMCTKTKRVVKELDELMSDWQTKLEKRGERSHGNGTGTHTAWQAGLAASKQNKPYPNWILPFSMASDNFALSKGVVFPLKSEKKMNDVWQAMLGGGALG